METTRQFYRVDRRQISFMRFIFEAYEGIAVVTTLDAVAGLIVLTVAPKCEAIVRAVINDLSTGFRIQPCQAPDGFLQGDLFLK